MHHRKRQGYGSYLEVPVPNGSSGLMLPANPHRTSLIIGSGSSAGVIHVSFGQPATVNSLVVQASISPLVLDGSTWGNLIGLEIFARGTGVGQTLAFLIGEEYE